MERRSIKGRWQTPGSVLQFILFCMLYEASGDAATTFDAAEGCVSGKRSRSSVGGRLPAVSSSLLQKYLT